MNQSVRTEGLENFRHKCPVGEIADPNFDLPPGFLFPAISAAAKLGNFKQRFDRLLPAKTAPQVIIDRHHLMARLRQSHCRGPAQIAVAPEDQHLHAGSRLSSPILPRTSAGRTPGSRRKRSMSASDMGDSFAE